MAGLLLAAVRRWRSFPGALIGARAPIHWDNRLLLAVAYALQAVGVVLSVAWPTIWGFGLGSLLLGMPFTAITLFAMRDARRLRGNASAGLIGYATASYGVGQILGPAVRRAAGPAHGIVRRAAVGRRGRADGRCVAFCNGLAARRKGQSGPNAVETPVSVTHLAYNSRLTTKRAGTNRPFFIGRSIFDAADDPRRVGNPAASCELKGEQRHVALQQTVEQTVAGLGYDLVEIERSAGGLLRVTIDLPWTGPNSEVLPPERRALHHGRGLREGHAPAAVRAGGRRRRVQAARGVVAGHRPAVAQRTGFRAFCRRGDRHHAEGADGRGGGGPGVGQPQEISRHAGACAAADGTPGWQIVWSEEPAAKPGQKISKKRVPAPLQALGFALDELREARLAPIVDFNGRRPKPGAAVSD